MVSRSRSALISVKSMELRSARPEERDEVLDLLALWYGDRNFFARYNQNDPAFSDSLCLVARTDNRLVGTAQIFEKHIRLDGLSLRAACLGSVFVHPDYRSLGIGSRLISLAVSVMEREDFQVSLLFSDRTNFYRRFGWELVPRPIAVIGPPKYREWRPLEAPGVIFRPFEQERDLADVMKIYDLYSGQFQTTVVRDLAYWLGNLVYAGNPDEFFVVGEQRQGESSRVVAYARVIRYFQLPAVMEYGYLPEAQWIMLALMETLLAIACGLQQQTPLVCHKLASLLIPPNEGCATAGLLAQIAHDGFIERKLMERGFAITPYDEKNFMWRLVKPERAFELMGWNSQEEFLRRLSAKDAVFWMADRF